METKSRLTPFDAELKAMITDVLGVQPELTQEEDFYFVKVDKLRLANTSVTLLEHAVDGRLKKRLIDISHTEQFVTFKIAYSVDSSLLPDLYENWETSVNHLVGAYYTPKGGNVKAIKVSRDNVDELIQFTGGGSMTIPRCLGGIATYSFLSLGGTFVDVPENTYIVRDNKDRINAYTEQEFKDRYELITTINPNN